MTPHETSVATLRYLPINIDIRGRRCVIIGGGGVATRKITTLVKTGADITVIAPTLTTELRDLAERNVINHIPRPYAHGDISGAFLAIAASSDAATNAAAAAEATAAGILIDVTDDPDAGNFTTPAYVSRGDLLITVSTGGTAPALARALRQELEGLFGAEYETVVRIHRAVRQKLLTENRGNSYTTEVLRSLAATDLPELAKLGARDDIDRLLLRLLGPGYSLAELGAADKEAP